MEENADKGRRAATTHVQNMSKRHAEVDLTRASDTEPEQDVPDTEEDLEWENPNQWRRLMTAIIIGAWIWCAKKIDGRKKHSVHQWGEELFENHQLRFLLRRDAVIPALLPSDRPFIQSKFICEPVPRWKPLDDYTYFFLRCQQWDNVDLELLAVAELRWVASGGILSMDSHENIRAYNNRILAQNRPQNQGQKPGETTIRKGETIIRRVP